MSDNSHYGNKEERGKADDICRRCLVESCKSCKFFITWQIFFRRHKQSLGIVFTLFTFLDAHSFQFSFVGWSFFELFQQKFDQVHKQVWQSTIGLKIPKWKTFEKVWLKPRYNLIFDIAGTTINGAATCTRHSTETDCRFLLNYSSFFLSLFFVFLSLYLFCSNRCPEPKQTCCSCKRTVIPPSLSIKFNWFILL